MNWGPCAEPPTPVGSMRFTCRMEAAFRCGMRGGLRGAGEGTVSTHMGMSRTSPVSRNLSPHISRMVFVRPQSACRAGVGPHANWGTLPEHSLYSRNSGPCQLPLSEDGFPRAVDLQAELPLFEEVRARCIESDCASAAEIASSGEGGELRV